MRYEPVVVIGLGRFGGALATELLRRGAEVLGIDVSPKVTQAFAGQLPHVVTADSTDMEALRQVGVAEFARAVVAIGTDIQASIVTTALLGELEVADIWAKAISQQHSSILSRVGAHHVVAPEHDMGERVAHMLSGRIMEYVAVDEDFAVIETRPPRDAVSIPLGQSGLRSKYGVTVVAVKSGAAVPGQPPGFTHTTPDTVLAYGDIILVVGKINDLERFAELD